MIDSGEATAPLSSPMTVDSWLAAGDGDASAHWFQSVVSQLIFPRVQVWGDVAAVGRADANLAREHFSRRDGRDSILGDPGSRFIWADGRLADTWPAAPDEDDYDRVRDSEVETLVISGNLDFAAPAENAARELMPHLPNGHQVILRDFGHSMDMWTEQKRAGSLINTYLDEGRVDTSLYRPRKIDFTPEVTQSALGKGLAGSMVGFAVITLVALLWLPRRVSRRGRIGTRTSVLLRSCSPWSPGSAAGSPRRSWS